MAGDVCLAFEGPPVLDRIESRLLISAYHTGPQRPAVNPCSSTHRVRDTQCVRAPGLEPVPDP